MTSSLVGSEMCIRDSTFTILRALDCICTQHDLAINGGGPRRAFRSFGTVSYTHLTLPTICSV
eukprot:10128127-Prorocentrum_lima.AAC.1